MRIVALESSGIVASVAVMENDKLIAEYTTNDKKTHSQTLLPMLDDILKMVNIDIEDIDAIAVSGGPGSFTGLRIGSATAKGLGLALDKPIVNIPTLEGLAYNLFGVKSIICPIMDAKRNQVFTGIYKFKREKLKTIKEQTAMDIEELIEELNSLTEEVIFVGDGIQNYSNIIKENILVDYYFAPPHLRLQRAGAIGILAYEYIKSGKIESADEHKPEYLRLSQAERQLKERLKNGEN